ncbi:hypothetical protein BLS_000426 [Venturia inaequalis]|uniref:Spindle pole body component n=1 Tax=Venturia inaequalis TaxID=5025 RepID=A0A8H3YJ30_VENIN|nr:hypothetical protein BLS_000426 [Venturia inaequalis]
MAQTIAVNTIIGELVTSIARVSGARKPREFRQLKESAARTAKQQQFVRTNQFEVEASLEGLVEKFSILNRDDLSEALAARLNELRNVSTDKWTPEILSLFLNLSDRPVENSSLEALNLIRPPSPPPPSISWEEIVADDPLTGELWADETYSTASSEDELETLPAAKASRAGQKSKSKTPAGIELPTELLLQVEDEHLKAAKAAQYWNASASLPARTQQISELQAVREVYAMLHGLPTSLFTVDLEHSLVFYSANKILSNISASSVNDLLQSLASIGSDILGVRSWVRKSPQNAVIQALNASTSLRLRQFDKQLTQEECCLVDSSVPIVVTLLQLHDSIREMSRPLVHLGQLVASVPSKGFTCLEMLYDKICISQAAEDAPVYELFARVFFECLKVYLRPVRRWMEAGDAADVDDTFFISVADKDCSAASLWHDRFKLRSVQDSQLYAPKFLHPAAKKILDSGKSIVFLKQLLQQGYSPSDHPEPILNYDTVCQSHALLSLAPFSELFSVAFDAWISSKYSLASSILREQLFHNCSLPLYLEQFQFVYLSKDGTVFQAFADEIFQRMDNRQKSWNDRFLLSELARSVFGGHQHIDPGRISVRTVQAKGNDRGVKSLSNVVIEFNVSYSRCETLMKLLTTGKLPWPILNVIQRTSFATYQRTFRLLLQIYRAKYILRQATVQFRHLETQLSRNRTNHHVRQQLGWFIDIMLSYVTSTVIETSTVQMHKSMAEADDIDAMAAVHQTFINRLQLGGLLAKNLAPIHDSIISILDLVLLHADNQARKFGSPVPRAQNSGQRGQRRYRHAKRRSTLYDEGTSDEEDEEDEYHADSEDSSGKEESYEDCLKKIHDQFGQLLNFTVAGLRGVGRAGGELSWEVLAERLEWGTSRVGG